MQKSTIIHHNLEAHMTNKGTYEYYRYDGNKNCYIKEEIKKDKNGIYVFITVDENGQRVETPHPEITDEILTVMDGMDHKWATSQERYYDTMIMPFEINSDPDSDSDSVAVIRKKTIEEIENSKGEPYHRGFVSAIGNPETELFHDEEEEKAVDKDIQEGIALLPEKLQNMFRDYFGGFMKLEEIKDAENEELGTNKSKQAFSKRKQELVKAMAEYLREKGYKDYEDCKKH